MRVVMHAVRAAAAEVRSTHVNVKLPVIMKARVLGFEPTHRPHSSSILGLPHRILHIWGLWVGRFHPKPCTSQSLHPYSLNI